MAAPTRTSRRGIGRPRRFLEETEIQLILDAATTVMRRNSYADATVQDILDEAGLSTRAFYRHFGSKDDLVKAIYRRDAERSAKRLADRVAAATSPRAAVEEWIDELLSFAYDARRAQRMAVIRAEVVREPTRYTQEERAAVDLMTRPLVQVLAAGKRDGSFPTTVPRRDAVSIYALTREVWRWVLDGRFRMSRRAALDHVLRFTLPALGWKGD